MQLRGTQVDIRLLTSAIAGVLGVGRHQHALETIMLMMDARPARSGGKLRLVHDGAVASRRVAVSLAKFFGQTHRWWARLRMDDTSLAELASSEGGAPPISPVLRLAVLSHALANATSLASRPAGISVHSLTLTGTVERSWSRGAFGHGS